MLRQVGFSVEASVQGYRFGEVGEVSCRVHLGRVLRRVCALLQLTVPAPLRAITRWAAASFSGISEKNGASSASTMTLS